MPGRKQKKYRTLVVTNMHQKCKLQTASFMLFMFQLTFCITFFQNSCSCSSGDNTFAKRLQTILIKNFIFLTPKRPQQEHFLWFNLLFSLFWPFRSRFFRYKPASKYCFWLQSRAFFAPRAPSAKMNVCIVATILSISYTICCFLCAFHAPSTFF